MVAARWSVPAPGHEIVTVLPEIAISSGPGGTVGPPNVSP